jgi:hypothetical protein
MTDDEHRIVIHESDWCCATWQNVFFLDWRGPADVQRAMRVVEAFDAFLRSRRDSIALMTVVNPEAPPPDSDARPIFANKMGSAGSRICGSAYYVPIDGFKGAAVRGAITALALLSRQAYPTRVFPRMPDAASWLAGRMGTGPDAVKRLDSIVARLQALGSP